MLVAFAFPICAATPQAASAAVDLGHMTLGYSYFNRAGADLKVHNAEVTACLADATRTISYGELTHIGQGQGLVGGILGGAFQAGDRRGGIAAALEDCMVVHGWRVVKLADDEGQTLAKLSQVNLGARLAPWVGATDPHGQIVRVWNNDAATAATNRIPPMPPSHTDDGQLSLIEATGKDLHQFDGGSPPADAVPDMSKAKPADKSLEPQQLSSAQPGTAIVLVRIKGTSVHNGLVMSFVREDTGVNVDPVSASHGADAFAAQNPRHRNDQMVAFAVAPGRWRVGAIANWNVLNFCLGSPSFDLAAGDVVYLGSFDLSAPDIGPDQDLTPARAWLAGQPQAGMVRQAAYMNGSRGACGFTEIYALEFKGAPFEPGYTWGGAAANPAMTTSKAP